MDNDAEDRATWRPQLDPDAYPQGRTAARGGRLLPGQDGMAYLLRLRPVCEAIVWELVRVQWCDDEQPAAMTLVYLDAMYGDGTEWLRAILRQIRAPETDYIVLMMSKMCQTRSARFMHGLLMRQTELAACYRQIHGGRRELPRRFCLVPDSRTIAVVFGGLLMRHMFGSDMTGVMFDRLETEESLQAALASMSLARQQHWGTMQRPPREELAAGSYLVRDQLQNIVCLDNEIAGDVTRFLLERPPGLVALFGMDAVVAFDVAWSLATKCSAVLGSELCLAFMIACGHTDSSSTEENAAFRDLIFHELTVQ